MFHNLVKETFCVAALFWGWFESLGLSSSYGVS